MAYRIEWLESARADVRRLDRAVAMYLFEGLLRFARTESGDLKRLGGDLAGLSRLRLGDYRILFRVEQGVMKILRVNHRSRAYE